ncbi:MAG: PIG-L family deacetylase [Acholeplasmataceae bacterium]|jgi:LmbE family N-acetylglucosaminyl deacetylase|nr:PIG-L family deacetylase [Acholeplasmataceae bacterium]
MKLNKKTAEFFIPDQKPLDEAIKRTTHMAIAAHQDDIEIMAYDGILKCFGNEEKWFFGVVVTDGAGSARDGIYKDYTNEEMMMTRKVEQRKAAFIGEYGALAMLDYASKEIKDPANIEAIDEMVELLKAAKPEVLYTHNLADKHDTHIGVATKVIKAIRKLDPKDRPKAVYGCEVWRDLDWMVDEEKVELNVSGHPNIAAALVEVFDSQIIGGKRYDLATTGRRGSNATYATSHKIDKATAISYAMDLTPLILDDSLDIITYITGYISRFKDDVELRIKKIIS